MSELTGVRVIVAGSRNWTRSGDVYKALDAFNAEKPIALVICGGCTGVDKHAAEWAAWREIPYLVIPARWKSLGKSAGPRRNRQMLNFAGIIPHMLLAFPGGVGTADMVKAATAAGVHVETITV